MAAPPTHPLISAQSRLVALFCPLFLEVSPGTQSFIPPDLWVAGLGLVVDP